MGAEQSAQGIGPEAAPRAMCARQGGDAALSLADLLPPAPPAPAAGVQQLPDGGPGDQRLLAHVAALLSQREGGTLLLSDLGALLPKDLRDRARMRGGLRSALQKYHMLVSVTGAPGKESVTSLLKGSELQSLPLFQKRGPDAKTGGHAASRIAAAAPQSACPESMSPSRREEDENHESVLQLRGLPYRATVTDVKGFLGRHGRNLKDERLGHPIRLIMNRDGRPSGFACVQLNSPMAARAARDELNGRMLDVAGGASVDGGAVRGGRYVEVFLFSERPNKLRFKNLLSADVPQEQAGGQDCHEVTAEEVRAECCAHMGVPGKGQLLLSMLGVALSPGARNYLKKTDQGLKQFLSRYPRQFFVEGAKGRESITYVAPASAAAAGQDGGRAPGGLQQRPGEGGTLPSHEQAPALALESRDRGDQLDRQPRQARHESGEHGPARQASAEDRIPTSPVPTAAASRLAWCENTPSIWGDSPVVGHGAAPRQPPPLQLPGAALGPGSAPGQGIDPAMLTAMCAGWQQPALPPLAGLVPPCAYGFPRAPPAPPWSAAAADGAPQGLPQPLEAAAPQQGPAAPAEGRPAPGPEADGPAGYVRLRGLPFTSTEQDVLSFFSKYDVVDTIHSGRDPVQLLTKAKGRRSGQAIVRLNSPSDAEKARDVLQGKLMEARYIEVFVVEGGQNPPGKPTPAPTPTPACADAGGLRAPAGAGARRPAGQQQRQPERQVPAPARPASPTRPLVAAAAWAAIGGMSTPERGVRKKWCDMVSPGPSPHADPLAFAGPPPGAWGHGGSPTKEPAPSAGDALLRRALFGSKPAPPAPRPAEALTSLRAALGGEGGQATAAAPAQPLQPPAPAVAGIR